VLIVSGNPKEDAALLAALHREAWTRI